MKNVIILGAGGNIARQVTRLVLPMQDVRLTLFLRDKRKLKNSELLNVRIVEGDVSDFSRLKNAITGQDIVYVNLAGDLGAMAKNIVRTMKETGVKKIILISSIGIYDSPLRSVLVPYRQAADIIEGSGLEYTILRPTWLTISDEINYETTRKGAPDKGTVISQKSLATLITKTIEFPEKYIRQNLGVNKPCP